MLRSSMLARAPEDRREPILPARSRSTADRGQIPTSAATLLRRAMVEDTLNGGEVHPATSTAAHGTYSNARRLARRASRTSCRFPKTHESFVDRTPRQAWPEDWLLGPGHRGVEAVKPALILTGRSRWPFCTASRGHWAKSARPRRCSTARLSTVRRHPVAPGRRWGVGGHLEGV